MEWRQIEGYCSYWVSNDGHIKTTNYNHTGEEKEIKTFKNCYGYLACNLMQDGKRNRKLVHRLVALAFIPNEYDLETVNHKDGNKTNNIVSNLEWMSVTENTKHAHLNGLVGKPTSGESHYRSKIPTKTILLIRFALSRGIKGRDIARTFLVSEKYVSALKRNKTRKHETI